MKKYYMKETGNEVRLGDPIELDFVKTEDGKVVDEAHISGILTLSLVPLLLKKGLMEVRESEDEKKAGNKKPDTFQMMKKMYDITTQLLDICKGLNAQNAEQEKRITELEEEMSKLLKGGKSGK